MRLGFGLAATFLLATQASNCLFTALPSMRQKTYVMEKLVPDATAALKRVVQVISPPTGNLFLARSCGNYYDLNGEIVCNTVREPGTCGSFEGAATLDEDYFGDYQTCTCFQGSQSSADCDCTTHTGGAGVPLADAVLYVTAAVTAACCTDCTTVAVGGYCYQETDTNRPVALFANICPDMLSTANSSHGTNLDTFVHELIHGLAMSSDLYGYFQDSSGNLIGSENVMVDDHIVTTRVREAMASQYSCSSTTGAPLENEGGTGTAGSHWEKRVMLDELMVGSTSGDRAVLSDITLAFLQDSGWYATPYAVSAHLAWGYHEGCSILEAPCVDQAPVNEYFCFGSVGTLGCSFDYSSVGFCAEDPLTDSCNYQYGFRDYACDDPSHATAQRTDIYGHYFGTDGRCIPDGHETWQRTDGYYWDGNFGCYQGVSERIAALPPAPTREITRAAATMSVTLPLVNATVPPAWT
eukprot:gene1079-1628_t